MAPEGLIDRFLCHKPSGRYSLSLQQPANGIIKCATRQLCAKFFSEGGGQDVTEMMHLEVKGRLISLSSFVVAIRSSRSLSEVNQFGKEKPTS